MTTPPNQVACGPALVTRATVKAGLDPSFASVELFAKLEQLGFVNLGPALATDARAWVDPEAGAGAC